MPQTFNAADNPILTGDATIGFFNNQHKNLRGQQPTHQFNTAFTELSYGDFIFPAASTVDFTDDPVVGSGGRNIFCRKLTFTVKFLVVTTYPITPTGGFPGNVAPLRSPINPLTVSCDRPMDIVRKLLSKPHQPFTCVGFGYGRLRIVGKSNSLSADLTKRYQTIVDIQNGPNVNTQPIGIQNLGAEAKLVTWTVVAMVPTNYRTIEEDPTGVLGRAHARLNQFPEDLTYRTSISLMDGYTTRTISGTLKKYHSYVINIPEDGLPNSIELPPSYQTLSASSQPLNTRSDQPLEWRTALDAVFPTMQGFSRNFPLLEQNEDRTELRFVIEDREISSDNPLEIGITRARAPYSIQASTPFAQWTVSLQVELEVAPHYPKVWGYYVFTRIYADLINRLYTQFMRGKPSPDLQTGDQDRTSATDLEVGTDANSRQYQYLKKEATAIVKVNRRPWAQLLSHQMTEDRYSRNITVSAVWTLNDVDLENIVLASGFAQPSKTGTTWELWGQSLGSVQKSTGFQRMSAPVDYLLQLEEGAMHVGTSPATTITDPNISTALLRQGIRPKVPYSAVTLTSQSNLKEDAKGDGAVNYPTQDPPEEEKLGPGEGYLLFSNKLTTFEERNSIASYRIDNVPLEGTQEVGNPSEDNPNPFLTEMGFYNSAQQSWWEEFASARLRHGRDKKWRVVLYGYAVRHTKIPSVPILRKVGDAIATPDGKGAREYGVEDVTELDGRTKRLYTVWWKQTYLLDRPPTGNKLESNFQID